MNEIVDVPPVPVEHPKAKRPYNRKKPLKNKRIQEGTRTETTRTEATREVPEIRTMAKKVRQRKNIGGPPLDFSPELLAWATENGLDFMWATNSINGQPFPQERMKYEINAWEPVTGDMWGGKFDGVYMPRGHKGEIVYEASVLLWRPLELTMEARAEEKRSADLPMQVLGRKIAAGAIEGVTLDTQHPSAKANTYVKREWIQGMPIPSDEGRK